jgi:anti-sigma B factor antagonist
LSSFGIDVQTDAPISVITLVGEIDVATCHDVRSLGVLSVQAAGITEVIIDMTGVTFIDSTGLGALIAVRNAARAADVTLRLRGITAGAAKLLKITGLDSVFEVE